MSSRRPTMQHARKNAEKDRGGEPAPKRIDAGKEGKERILNLLKKYLILMDEYAKIYDQIQEEMQEKIHHYRKRRGAETERVLSASELVRYVDEFVDHLFVYYAYYRSTRRSLHTLFASVGITNMQMFAEMVRQASDPRIMIRPDQLDEQGVNWFLGQFLADFQEVEVHREQLLSYLPHLEEACRIVMSGAMEKFREVLRYVASDNANELRTVGLRAVNRALKEEDFGIKLNLVAEAIAAFVKWARNHPAFILTESPGFFGAAELEEFDRKIKIFEEMRQRFKEHLSLRDRTQWVFAKHHTVLMSSIFDGPRVRLIEIMHRLRRGVDSSEFPEISWDYKSMLLGVAQSNSLFLEFSAYSDQMLRLVESYKDIAEFLQSELLRILYDLEARRNKLYLKMKDGFKQVLADLQQVLVEICAPKHGEQEGIL